MRVELIPLAGLAPETSAYTNSATSAALSNIPSLGQKVDYGFYDDRVIVGKVRIIDGVIKVTRIRRKAARLNNFVPILLRLEGPIGLMAPALANQEGGVRPIDQFLLKASAKRRIGNHQILGALDIEKRNRRFFKKFQSGKIPKSRVANRLTPDRQKVTVFNFGEVTQGELIKRIKTRDRNNF
mgnify:CR=1 FL=1